MSRRPLHVFVGVAPPVWPDAPVGFAVDVQLVKAALLYGDAATLCSPAASLAARVLDVPDGAAALDTLVALADDFGLGDSPRRLAADRAAIVADPAAPYYAERLARLDAVADEWWGQVRGALREELRAGGHGELLAAVRSGALRLDPLDVGALASPADFAPVAADAYADRVGAALSGLSVPLLDGATLDLLRQRDVPEPDAGWRGREGGLVADWLPRLPVFDRATVDEVLDVRRELGGHVARFRAAVVEFAEAVGPAVWDAGFAAEAERRFRLDVAPAVADIEDAVASTGPLRALVSRYADRPGLLTPFAAPALALGLSDATLAVEIGATVLAGGFAAANAAHAWWASRDARRAVEGNRLFFYYAAGRGLAARER